MFSDRPARVFDTPVAMEGGKNRYLLGNMRAILAAEAKSKFAVIELAHAMPQQGGVSMFSFGEGYGLWKGLLSGLSIPYDVVSPAKWKRDMLEGRGKGKGASRIHAQELFPELESELRLVKHDGRAEALLIAAWARRRGA